jgi:glycerol-3-phosphate acyltransferase PlsY
MLTYLTIAVVAYLLGSIPFGYLLVRAFRGHDIRESGSGNIGATNVARSGGIGLALATLLLDAGKGFLAVVVSGLLFLPELLGWAQLFADTQMLNPSGPPFPPHVVTGMFVGGLFAILGHMFPVWLRFKGGKGVATGIGAFGPIAPGAALVSLIVFVAATAISKRVSVGSITAAAVFPFVARFSVVHASPNTVFLTTGLAALLIILKHHENLRRLFAGAEPRFQWRRT